MGAANDKLIVQLHSGVSGQLISIVSALLIIYGCDLRAAAHMYVPLPLLFAHFGLPLCLARVLAANPLIKTKWRALKNARCNLH